MKKVFKSTLAVLLVIILGGCTTTVEKKDTIDYKSALESVLFSEEYMPGVNEVEGNDNYTLKTYKNKRLFGGTGITLTEQLSAEEYEKKLDEINNTYLFLEEPQLTDYDEEHYTIPQAEFEIEGYKFRVLSDGTYPKYFGMIAVSDEEHRIIYFACDCQDLDYIEDMEDFIKENYPRWYK